MNLSLDDFKEGQEEVYNKECPKCAYRTFLKRKGPHVGWYCMQCGFLKWMPQSWKVFIMPFGKHKGKTLQEIKNVDIEYIRWASEKMENVNIKNKMIEALNCD